MPLLVHDPEFPFVFRYSSGDKPIAKFRKKNDAETFADNFAYGQVIDTTPPPPLPTERGVWALGEFDMNKLSNLMVHFSEGWYRISNSDATPWNMSDTEVREALKTATRLTPEGW